MNCFSEAERRNSHWPRLHSFSSLVSGQITSAPPRVQVDLFWAVTPHFHCYRGSIPSQRLFNSSFMSGSDLSLSLAEPTSRKTADRYPTASRTCEKTRQQIRLTPNHKANPSFPFFRLQPHQLCATVMQETANPQHGFLNYKQYPKPSAKIAYKSL